MESSRIEPTIYTREYEKRVYSKVTWRLIPFLFMCYIFAYVDRVNVGFAKLQMQHDLGISDAVYGTGAGIFFIGYFFFEIPCNIALEKIGAKYWLGPIMIVWGLVSACTMLVTGQWSFYLLRFTLGVVECGFFPGVILYLTFWFTGKYRAKMVAGFMTAIPLSGLIGGPISGWLLNRMAAVGGLKAWQWLFLVEAIPSLLAGVATMFFLSDNPAKAKWLSAEERGLLMQRLEEDEAGKRQGEGHGHSFAAAFSKNVWLFALIYFGVVTGNYGLQFWIPQIISDTITKNPFHIGLLTMIPWGVTAVAMVLVGRHSDATGERCWHVATAATVGGLGLALSAIPGISGAFGLGALTIATAGIISSTSTFWSLPTSYLSGTAASAGIAWINSIGNLGGQVGPYVVGAIHGANKSHTPALLLLSLSCVMSAVVTVAFFRKRPVVRAAAA
jgi:MFS family permease